MPVYVYSVPVLISFAIGFVSGAKDGNFVPCLTQRTCFLPHTEVERHGNVFDNNEYLSFHCKPASLSKMFIEPSQCTKHGGLTPMKCRRFVHNRPGITPIIKIAGRVLHVFKRPPSNFTGELQGFGITLPEKNQRIDRL